MRLRALGVLALVLAGAACGSLSLFRQYEYEEDVYLSLDGTATVYVNTSIAALNALRGTSFDTSPTVRTDRDLVRAYYSGPVTHVVSVRTSRRSNRRFVHLRLAVDDITRIGAEAPFAWSTYEFHRVGDEYVYRQTLGAAAGRRVDNAGWTGRETVAFRLHLPSRITFHPADIDIRRGNILVWEQPLADRLRGVPLTLDARMDTQSILYRTLWLFAATFVVVAAAFLIVIWWVLKRAPAPAAAGSDPGRAATGA